MLSLESATLLSIVCQVIAYIDAEFTGFEIKKSMTEGHKIDLTLWTGATQNRGRKHFFYFELRHVGVFICDKFGASCLFEDNTKVLEMAAWIDDQALKSKSGEVL